MREARQQGTIPLAALSAAPEGAAGAGPAAEGETGAPSQGLYLAAQIVRVSFQGAHQAPSIQGPGELEHAAERRATLLESAVEVSGVSGCEPCALALDGLHHLSDHGLTQEDEPPSG